MHKTRRGPAPPSGGRPRRESATELGRAVDELSPIKGRGERGPSPSPTEQSTLGEQMRGGGGERGGQDGGAGIRSASARHHSTGNLNSTAFDDSPSMGHGERPHSAGGRGGGGGGGVEKADHRRTTPTPLNTTDHQPVVPKLAKEIGDAYTKLMDMYEDVRERRQLADAVGETLERMNGDEQRSVLLKTDVNTLVQLLIDERLNSRHYQDVISRVERQRGELEARLALLARHRTNEEQLIDQMHSVACSLSCQLEVRERDLLGKIQQCERETEREKEMVHVCKMQIASLQQQLAESKRVGEERAQALSSLGTAHSSLQSASEQQRSETERDRAAIRELQSRISALEEEKKERGEKLVSAEQLLRSAQIDIRDREARMQECEQRHRSELGRIRHEADEYKRRKESEAEERIGRAKRECADATLALNGRLVESERRRRETDEKLRETEQRMSILLRDGEERKAAMRREMQRKLHGQWTNMVHEWEQGSEAGEGGGGRGGQENRYDERQRVSVSAPATNHLRASSGVELRVLVDKIKERNAAKK